MYGFFAAVVWVMIMILGITWLFLPWIIIAKMDGIINELHNISQLLAKTK